MSFVARGTFAATVLVTLSPDLSGNFVATGAADQVEINAAIVYCAAVGGGEVAIGYGGFTLAATVNVPAGVLLRGMGWTTILNYDAGIECILFTGANAKLRDLKIVITAGAGGAGTRPNGIVIRDDNIEVSGCWIVGDLTEADDGSDNRQIGILLDGTNDYAFINNNRIENFERHGIRGVFFNDSLFSDNIVTGCLFDGIWLDNQCNDNVVSGNNVNNNGQIGINVETDSQRNIIIGNTSNNNGEEGIEINDCLHTVIIGNECHTNTQQGIRLLVSSHFTVISGNHCIDNSLSGIDTGANNCIIAGNHCEGNTEGIISYSSASNVYIGNVCALNSEEGIQILGTDNHTITGNICYQNTKHGIMVDGGDNNTIVGNSCNENDFANTATYSGINITGASLDNIIHSNTCNLNDLYGIDIDDANSLRNWVKNNQLRGNTTAPMRDSGTGTKFATISYQFTEPIVGAIVVATPTGVDVDANTEGALAWGQIPMEVQQVMRLKLWGVATDGPIGAGGQMHLEIIFNAGASNAAYNEAAKSWSLANFDGEEADYVANDVVHWEIVDGDVGTELSAIVAGDSFEIFAMHEAGAAPDGATDCLFRVVEVDYV